MARLGLRWRGRWRTGLHPTRNPGSAGAKALPGEGGRALSSPSPAGLLACLSACETAA